MKRSQIKRALLAVICGAALARAQEVSPSDFFDLTEPLTVEQPSSGAPVHGLMAPFLRAAASQRPTPFFTSGALAPSVGREEREPRLPTGYELDIDRGEFRVELVHGSLTDAKKLSVVRVKPSYSYLRTRGENGAKTKRRVRTVSPSLSLSYAPLTFNREATKDNGLERAFTLLIVNQAIHSNDLASNGVNTGSRQKTWTLSPSFDYARNIKVHARIPPWTVRLNAVFNYRRNKEEPEAADFKRSTATTGTLNASATSTLDQKKLWSLTLLTNYDFPIHEKPATGKPPMGDASVGTTARLARKIGTDQVSLEYKQLFRDRNYQIQRYTLGYRSQF